MKVALQDDSILKGLYLSGDYEVGFSLADLTFILCNSGIFLFITFSITNTLCQKYYDILLNIISEVFLYQLFKLHNDFLFFWT